MEYDDFLKLLRKRRSIRDLKPDPIPDEYVDKIIEAARWAMSGANAQPWEFIIVKNQETKNKIADICHELRQKIYVVEETLHTGDLRHPGLPNPPKAPPSSLRNAPVLIVVCGDGRTLEATILAANFVPWEGGYGAVYYKNLANATQNIHLAAASLGLGSQWFSIGDQIEAELKALLEVPQELTLPTIVPIGYPAYQPAPSYRRGREEIMHFEKYDRSKYRTQEDIYEYIKRLRKHARPAYPRRLPEYPGRP